jgi:hypothetical protein
MAVSFVVTKQFVSGALKGLTIEDRSPVAFEVGKTYTCCGSRLTRYQVIACREVAP